MAKRPRTERVAVELPPMETAAERWLRTIRFSGFTFVMLGLVILAVIVLAPGLKILVEQQQQISALQAEVEAGKQSVDGQKDDVARWSDPSYIKSQARDRLQYAFPGDVTYLVIDDGATVTTADGAPISTSIQTTKVDWMQSVLASVFTAGLTDAVPADLAPAP